MERPSDCPREVLLIWIKERRKLNQLQLMVDRQPSAQMLEVVERMLVMNEPPYTASEVEGTQSAI
jgi:hypothetical protein